MEPLLQVRDYWTYPDRYSVADTMWQGHKGIMLGKFPENLVPPLAVFVTADDEPVAFMACYQAVGIGVGIMDLITTKPGMSFAESRRALLFASDAILKVLHANDYGLCIAYGLPGASRVFARAGWQDHGEKTHLMIATKPIQALSDPQFQ